ncbi:MAG: T9SS type A sorting domain-containing protein [Cytophagaceae bacterium]
MRKIFYALFIFVSFTAVAQPMAPNDVFLNSTSISSISIYWIDDTQDEDGYFIERSLDGENWQQIIGPVPPSLDYYEDQDLEEGVLYYYRIVSFIAGGFSSYSEVYHETTWARPVKPEHLTATAVSDTKVNLTWDYTFQPNQNLVFRIYRANNLLGPYENNNAVFNQTSFSENELQPNTTYFYFIEVVDFFTGLYNRSDTVEVKTPVTTSSSLGTSFDISFYPNPAYETLNINYNGLDNLEIKITSLEGRIEIVKTIGSADVINLSELKSGIYFLICSDGNGLLKKDKLVVK